MSVAEVVSWSSINAAIQANPSRKRGPGKAGAVSGSLDVLPADESVPWLKGWSEDRTLLVQDGIALSLWIRDPLYRTATDSVRNLMEMEEASTLLNLIDVKGHGWVRKHLEEDLRARGGGALASANFWELVRTQKRAAQLLDYICSVRGFRVGLWWPEQVAVTNIPLVAGDSLVQVNCESARIMIGPTGFNMPRSLWRSAVFFSEMTWSVPASGPSIGATTVGQITAELEALRPGGHKGNRAQLWKMLQFERACQP